METNDKKPKRPRIAVSRGADDSDAVQDTSRFERVSYTRRDNSNTESASEESATQHGGYQHRSYNNYNQGGYNNNRPQGGGYGNRQGGYNNRYNNQGGYQNNGNRQQGGYGNNRFGQQGGYNQRPYNNYNRPAYNRDNQTGEHETGETKTDNYQNGGYQPRTYNNRGYQNNGSRQQGGYQNRGYQNNGNRQQGGYGNNRPQQGGYNRGYQNNGNRQQGGYGNNRPQQGGYNNRGYNNGNRQQGGFNQSRPGKSFTPRPKRIEYEMPIPDPNEQIRLNKFMANAGICSRREADEFIQQGLVKVNGQVVTELGTKISHSDTVEYDEKVIALESKCYILLNKPKDCVTTSDDPQGRLTVMDLVKGACTERIYPVGRLDRNTTGVLLLTNDGDLASKLTHPQYVKKKIYHVWTDKDISEDDMQRIADGIELEDGPIHADAISYATEKDRNQAGIEIHSGRNRIVRRIFESLGYHVTKLDRVYFAGLTKKNLPRGRWRYLTQEEVNFLKMGSFE
ncbi:MAG: RNA-binding S4 domain-containing protein [Muribaculaceae bacterium]|nr:RNA-binding S4 domain-containing protein [Muribaculaceae bacterium]